ncbi:hypothetical protein JOS77_04470 [Chromobacterium haemolyticum]|nr:hypothetical protein JOS77_04470 [Chromobacterium haemolyticum]
MYQQQHAAIQRYLSKHCPCQAAQQGYVVKYLAKCQDEAQLDAALNEVIAHIPESGEQD